MIPFYEQNKQDFANSELESDLFHILYLVMNPGGWKDSSESNDTYCSISAILHARYLYGKELKLILKVYKTMFSTYDKY